MQKQTAARRILSWISVVMLVFVCVFQTVPAFQISAASTEAAVKIMPLGDSITDCDFWRTTLFNKLKDNGYNVESVGCQYGGHEGHSGMLVTDLAQTTQLSTWLSSTNPDIVMMHFGTNDCWCDKGSTAILNAYTTLVKQMRANNPNMIIVVAQITPLQPNDSADYISRAKDLDEHMVGWAADLTTEASPIILCDQFTGFVPSTDTYDGVHPNSIGSAKMVTNWYNTLTPILDGVTPSVQPTATSEVTPSVEPTATTEVTPSAQPTATTEVTPSSDLQLSTDVNAWEGGYTMNASVKNTSNSAVNSWKLTLNKADFDITNAWCVNIEESGDFYIITPQEWNASIPAGGSVNFGFQANGRFTADFVYTLK